MRNSAASDIHAHEVRAKGVHHLPGHDSGYIKEAGVLLGSQLMPPGNMPLGNHQAVAIAKGIDIQDAQRQVVLVDLMRGSSLGHNIAKDTGFFGLIRHIPDSDALLENANYYSGTIRARQP